MFRSSIPTAAKFCSWSCLHFLSICNQTSQERPQNDRYIRPFTISTAANVKVPTNSRLYQDQNLSHTAKGHNKVTKEHVSLAKLPSFMESNYDSEMLQRSSGDPVNSQTTKIIQNLYVTSLGGLKSKQLLNYKVNLLLNATIDLPNVDVPNAETIRVPISEKEPDTLTIYINDVADKIHENYLKNGQTVIYCLDGNRNSMALSLGYLLKYTDLQLSEALTHLQYSRKGFEMMKGNLGPFKKPVELFAKKVKKNEGLGSNDRSVSNEERSNSKQKSTSNSSSSGIGEATAKRFAEYGANVVVTGRKAENVTRIANECRNLSPYKIVPLEIVGDVTNELFAKRLIDDTISRFGRLDILVNNAGFAQVTSILDPTSLTNFDRVNSLDVRSVINLTLLAVPYLSKTKGNIVNISSLCGIKPLPGFYAYCMAKAAIDMFTKCISLELGSMGIRVNAINPGGVKTNFFSATGMTNEQVVEQEDILRRSSPIGLIGDPYDIADLTIFLSSNDSKFMTGSCVLSDGGTLNSTLHVLK